MTKSRQLSCLLMFPVLVALAALPDAIASGQAPGTEKEQNRKAEEALEQPITLDYADERFGDVMDEWSANSGVRFLLHPSAVDNNLDNDKLITLKLDDVRMATVLTFILETYECTWQFRDGIVRIVSDDFAVENPQVAAIDCSSILAGIQPLKRQRIVPSSLSAGASGGFGGGGGVFSVVMQDSPQQRQAADSSAGTTQQTPPETIKTQPSSPVVVINEVISPESQLINLIETVVDPDSWESNGGTGRMLSLNGKLFVVTTCENHRRVKALIEELRTTSND